MSVDVRGLKITIGGKPIVSDADMTIADGERVGLIGSSGSGKSMIAKAMLGLLPLTAVTNGSIDMGGTEIIGASERALADLRGRYVGTVFQNPAHALNPVMTVAQQIALPLRLHYDLTKAERADRVNALLSKVGLDLDMAGKYPHELSGGQQQRVGIATALITSPRFIIADEPTTALDSITQRQIVDLLTSLVDDAGASMLFITHDLGLAAERAQHIVVMYKGQVVESGPSLEVLQHPQHPYTKRLVAAAPSLASQRIISAKERGEDADALLDHHIAGESTLEKSEHIITVDHLTKEFKLPRKKEMFKAVDDVSFSVKRGTTLAIVGESGSGKSTVANMVLHLLKPTSGKVFYEGRDTSTFKSKDLLGFRRHVQPVFQNPYGSLDPMYSIFRSIEEPLRIHKIGDKKWRANRVKELLDMVEMPASVMGRYPNELSGGQRQRIAIARAMALDPDVIVCDEAVSALDVLVQDQVLRLLNDLQAEKGLSYLFITHDLAVVRQIADEVVVMQHGKLVEHATTDEVFDHPQKQYTRDLLDAIPGGKLQLGLD